MKNNVTALLLATVLVLPGCAAKIKATPNSQNAKPVYSLNSHIFAELVERDGQYIFNNWAVRYNKKYIDGSGGIWVNLKTGRPMETTTLTEIELQDALTKAKESVDSNSVITLDQTMESYQNEKQTLSDNHSFLYNQIRDSKGVKYNITDESGLYDHSIRFGEEIIQSTAFNGTYPINGLVSPTVDQLLNRLQSKIPEWRVDLLETESKISISCDNTRTANGYTYVVECPENGLRLDLINKKVLTDLNVTILTGTITNLHPKGVVAKDSDVSIEWLDDAIRFNNNSTKFVTFKDVVVYVDNKYSRLSGEVIALPPMTQATINQSHFDQLNKYLTIGGISKATLDKKEIKFALAVKYTNGDAGEHSLFKPLTRTVSQLMN